MFEPVFKLSNPLVNNLVEIGELKALIENSHIVPKQEAILKRKAAVRMAASSTAIEGNRLNQNEVEKVFEGKPVFAGQKDEIEVRNYKKGIEFINTLHQDKIKLSPPVILKVHNLLMTNLLPPEKTGHFRGGAVYVVNVGPIGKDELLYTAPESTRIEKLIRDLLIWVKDAQENRLHPVVIAGIFHYEFVTIHPFTDGNGRMTRLLTQYLLYQMNYAIDKIYTLDSFYNQDRRTYYQNLDIGKTYDERKMCDLTPWLEYFTDGFIWELGRIREQINLIKLQTQGDNSPTIYLDQDEVRILDYIATVGRVTSREVKEILQFSQRSAQLKLKKLAEENLIEMKGSGPSSFYILKK